MSAGRLAAVVTLALALCAPARAGGEARDRSHLQNFKDQMLATCIARAYAAEPRAAKDAADSAAGYNEWSGFDVEAGGEQASALIDRTLAQTYGSWQGPSVRLDLMKCLDLYHGAELEALGRRHVTDPDKIDRDEAAP